MLVEATLDFPEEEIDFLQRADARGQLDAIDGTLAEVMRNAKRGALLQGGMQVVLAGQPNVGKSSLLNALAGAELAIVTPVPGTTRDRIGQSIQIEGVPLHVTDTAGLRDDAAAADEVERIGIARSWSAIADADAVVFLHDLTRQGDPDYAAGEARIADRFSTEASGVLHVYNKADLAAVPLPDGALAISALTGAGLPALRQALLAAAGWEATTEGVFIARARHLDALARTQAHLLGARRHLAQGDTALDLFAEELRLAHDALAEITGAFSADDLLGEIFGRFCIGK
jgi:tRNA modification GTPase